MAKFNPADYETVNERIKRFKKDWPDSDIVTDLVEHEGAIGATRWIARARVWREKGYERPDSTGWAFEVDGGDLANRTSALENCETSAIGRALANLNYSGDKRASREEMEKVQRAESVASLRERLNTVTDLDGVRDLWREASKQGVLNVVKDDLERARERFDQVRADK